jgi:hypothetical protein
MATMSAEPGLSRNHRRALALLADCPDGLSEAIMLAHGFTAMLIAELIIAGFASASVDQVRNGTLEVVRLKITNAGRQAIAR